VLASQTREVRTMKNFALYADSFYLEKLYSVIAIESNEAISCSNQAVKTLLCCILDPCICVGV